MSNPSQKSAEKLSENQVAQLVYGDKVHYVSAVYGSSLGEIYVLRDEDGTHLGECDATAGNTLLLDAQIAKLKKRRRTVYRVKGIYEEVFQIGKNGVKKVFDGSIANGFIRIYYDNGSEREFAQHQIVKEVMVEEPRIEQEPPADIKVYDSIMLPDDLRAVLSPGGSLFLAERACGRVVGLTLRARVTIASQVFDPGSVDRAVEGVKTAMIEGLRRVVASGKVVRLLIPPVVTNPRVDELWTPIVGVCLVELSGEITEASQSPQGCNLSELLGWPGDVERF